MSGLTPLTLRDWYFIGYYLEGFFYGKIIYSMIFTIHSKSIQHHCNGSGIYSGIFVIYLKHQAQKKSTDDRRTTIVFYSLCILYFLSVVQVVSDIFPFVSNNSMHNNSDDFMLCSSLDLTRTYWRLPLIPLLS